MKYIRFPVHLIVRSIFLCKYMIMSLKLKKQRLSLFVMFVFGSCTFNNGVTFSNSIEAPIVENKQLTVLNDTSLWNFPQAIGVTDSFLIVLDNYDGLFFRTYSLDGKPLTAFGNRGQGPGEFLNVRKFHLSSDNKLMYAFDEMSYKIVEYNVDSLLSEKKVFQEYLVDRKKIPQSNIPTILYDMIPLKERLFLVKANHGDFRFGIFEASDKRIVPVYRSFLEEGLDITSREELWSLFSGMTYTALSPDKSKLVNATYIGGIMEMFTVDGEREKISLADSSYIYEPVYGLAQGAIPAFVVPDDKTQIGFEDVCVTDELIYAVLRDIGEHDKPTFITVFDWKGNIQKRIEVGKRIEKICIDEHRKRMYLLVSNKENGYELDVMTL